MKDHLPSLPHQLALYGLLRVVGIIVKVSVTGAEALTLDVDDVLALHECGVTDRMLDDLRAQAQAAPADRIFELDVERQRVDVECSRITIE